MTQPINPNTLLPMSLEVDKIQQIKHLQILENQGLIAQQRENEKERKQSRVNNGDKTEGKIIKEDKEEKDREESGGNSSPGKKDRNKKDKSSKSYNSVRGNNFDIKI